MSTLKVNSLQPATAGSEDYALCRAWIALHQSTFAIRDSFKISSAVDVANARVDINLSTTMTNANYACPSQQNQSLEFYTYGSACGNESKTTTSARFYNRRVTDHSAFDFGILHVAFIGNV